MEVERSRDKKEEQEEALLTENCSTGGASSEVALPSRWIVSIRSVKKYLSDTSIMCFSLLFIFTRILMCVAISTFVSSSERETSLILFKDFTEAAWNLEILLLYLLSMKCWMEA